MEKTRELTVREAGILLALVRRELSGYGIVRQCYEDTLGDVNLSNGTVFPALARLEKLGAVEKAEAKTGRLAREKSKPYRLTRMGRQLLDWQLSAYRRMVRLGQERI